MSESPLLLLQQLCCISGGGGSSQMDAGVLGVCINEDQPVGTLEVDFMVHMHSATWFLW